MREDGVRFPVLETSLHMLAPVLSCLICLLNLNSRCIYHLSRYGESTLFALRSPINHSSPCQFHSRNKALRH